MGAFDFFNSKEQEWADININIGGSSAKSKIEAVKYGVKSSKEHLFAGGDDPVGIQSGNREPTGSIKLLKGAVDVMNAAAVAAGGRDLTDLQFDMVIIFKAVGTRPIQTITLVGCEISEFNVDWTQGAKKSEVDLPFLFLNYVATP